MSDRRNRDIGKKRERQKHRVLCDCWLCMPGKDKKRAVLARQAKYLRQLEDRHDHP